MIAGSGRAARFRQKMMTGAVAKAKPLEDSAREGKLFVSEKMQKQAAENSE
ncbi:hypothetical protein MesoLj131b_73460 (plasmid) [Mesorhizobium sp. 131-2-5]|nr:hypothetical protein MesoLj131b_73460 [Mesorhizobium sp. 131-2-5]